MNTKLIMTIYIYVASKNDIAREELRNTSSAETEGAETGRGKRGTEGLPPQSQQVSDCTFGGVYIPCIYSHARWSYRRRFRSLLLCPLSVERYCIPLLVDSMESSLITPVL